jgi:transcriptional regulator with XRE-family HTH domain
VTEPWWSEFLRQLRRRLDLSQRELARRAGVPKSTVGDVEAGRIDPGLGTLERLLEAAGLRLEVVDRTDRPVDFHGDTSQPLDAAGRRLPPHLDARLRHPGSDPQYPSLLRPGPAWTYHLDRSRRDAVPLADRFGVWGCGPPRPGGLDWARAGSGLTARP